MSAFRRQPSRADSASRSYLNSNLLRMIAVITQLTGVLRDPRHAALWCIAAAIYWVAAGVADLR